MKKEISITIITHLLEDIEEFDAIRNILREIIGEYFQYESNFMNHISYRITGFIPVYEIEKICDILKDLKENCIFQKIDTITLE